MMAWFNQLARMIAAWIFDLKYKQVQKQVQRQREKANAIALSGERELLTDEALNEHARQLRAALEYDTNDTDTLSQNHC